MIYEITGAVKRVLPAQTKLSFTFQTIHLNVQEGEYTNIWDLQASGNQMELVNGLAEGDQVTVRFAIKGREWTSPQGEVKVFMTLKIISISRQGYTQPF